MQHAGFVILTNLSCREYIRCIKHCKALVAQPHRQRWLSRQTLELKALWATSVYCSTWPSTAYSTSSHGCITSVILAGIFTRTHAPEGSASLYRPSSEVFNTASHFPHCLPPNILIVHFQSSAITLFGLLMGFLCCFCSFSVHFWSQTGWALSLEPSKLVLNDTKI